MPPRVVILSVILLVTCFGLFGCFTQVQPISNEPEGFRGIKWGQSAQAVAGLKLVETVDDFCVYRRQGESLSIGRAQLADVLYGFYKDRFFSARLKFNELNNYNEIKEHLIFLYGEGEPDSTTWRSRRWWSGPAVSLKLEYVPVMQTGSVVYLYTPIYDRGIFDVLEETRRGRGKL